MKNIFERLKGRKGFTLVECLVAIAVFAALVLVIFAILTNARVAAKNANETEENLTLLIDNIVDDETYRKYTNDTEVLDLNISGAATGTFKISYNEIDGYKNFLLCPNAMCGEFTDNIAFMPAGTKQEDFAQATKFKCPSCEEEFTSTLLCEECGNTGEHIETDKFTYIPTTGGFYCNECGGVSVKDENVEEKVASDIDLVVTGMTPNAIKYGDVEQSGAEFDKFYTFDAAGNELEADSYQLNLEYKASSNMSLPGVYTLNVIASGSEISGMTDLKIRIPLPAYYNVVDFKIPSGGTAIYENYNPNSGEAGYILITSCTANLNSQPVEFRLANYKSGISFEDDYNAVDMSTMTISEYEKQGLGGYWFGGSSASTPTINSAGYVDEITWSAIMVEPEPEA